MKSAAIVLTVVTAMAGPARAQAPAATAPTVLHLSETQSVPVVADEIVARLDASGDASSAAASQHAVNVAMTKALTQARAVAGIAISTGSYTVWQDVQKGRWQAHQTLVLHGKDGAAMLALVGNLQSTGLAVQSLGWQLSDAAGEAAGKAATMKALAMLRARAEAIGKVLGEHLTGFSRIDVTDGQPPSRPMPLMMTTRAVAEPSAVAPQDLRQSATVTADALLKP